MVIFPMEVDSEGLREDIKTPQKIPRASTENSPYTMNQHNEVYSKMTFFNLTPSSGN